MLRMTILSKIQHIYALTLVPRLLRGDICLCGAKFGKLSLNANRNKSSSSSNGESEGEKCQKIIDRAFAATPHSKEPTKMKIEAANQEKIAHFITPQIPSKPENKCEKCKKIIQEIFGEELSAAERQKEIEPICIPIPNTLQSTTSREHVETLAQKIEKIDETPLVEAAKPKIEGFNAPPRVLGKMKRKKVDQRGMVTLHSSVGRSTQNRKGGSTKRNSLDELARRCLNSPSGQIDERLLKEMKTLGVPQSGRGAVKRTDDGKVIQPNIMKKPRKPVQKIDLDLATMEEKEVDGFIAVLTPPFELTHGKMNNVCLDTNYDINDISFVQMERVQLWDWKDPFLTERKTDSKSTTLDVGNIPIKASIENVKDKLQQKVLEHMTTAFFSDEMKSTDLSRDETKSTQLDRDKKKSTELSRDEKKSSEPSKDTVCQTLYDKEDTEFYIEKLENNQLTLNAKEYILPDFQDTLRPEILSTCKASFEIESRNIDTLQTLLQTRLEHLSREKIKSQYSAYNSEGLSQDLAVLTGSTDFSKDPTTQMDSVKAMSKETTYNTEPGVVTQKHEVTLTNFPYSSEQCWRHIKVVDYDYNENKYYSYEAGRIQEHNLLDFDNERPVIGTETGRIEPCKDQEKEKKTETKSGNQTVRMVKPSQHSYMPAENFVKPLLDKSTVVHAISAEPKPVTDNEQLPLSELLRRVRERNRLEYCKGYIAQMRSLPEVEPVVGKCGKKKPRCPPPTPTCPSPPPKPCPPRPPCPKPCKPKCPPPTCPPPAPKCPPPCPPPRCPPPSCPPPKCPSPCPPSSCPPPCPRPPPPKCCPPPQPCNPCQPPKSKCSPPVKRSPCDKFKSKCPYIQIQDALTLLLYLGPQLGIPQKAILPLIIATMNSNSIDISGTRKTQLTEEIVTKLHNICCMVWMAVRYRPNTLDISIEDKENISYARTYDPWTPIPSWPIQQRNEQKKLVCPKEGCKYPPSKLNPPNPCTTFPKPHSTPKRTFSLDKLLRIFRKSENGNMLYDITEV